MNPASSSRPGPSQPPRGCEGDGCGSAPDIWPLYCVFRSGVRTRLCSSCVVLSHRSYYCCACFFLIPCPSLWLSHEDGNPLTAPTAPITTCQVCREAIAHLACLQPPPPNGAFVCPACSAAAEGRSFTYAPPCNTPIDQRGSRVLFVAAQLALVLLQRNASMAREEAERLARNAVVLRMRAQRALDAVNGYDRELPSSNTNVAQETEPVMAPPPPSRRNRRLERGEGSQTRANAPPPSRRHLERGEGSQTRVNAPPRSRTRVERSVENRTRAANAPPQDQQLRPAMPLPALSALTIGSRSVTQLAMAATEAARNSPLPPPRTLPLFNETDAAMEDVPEASPPTPPTLQLFPVKPSSSSRTKPRTMRLFKDKM